MAMVVTASRRACVRYKKALKRLGMPKPGTVGLTLKKEVYELLKAKAREAGIGVNQYLEYLLIGRIRQSWGQSQTSKFLPL